MRILTAAISALYLGCSNAFSHPRVIPLPSNPRAAKQVVVAVDQNVIMGVGVGLAGLLGGVGIMALTEKQAIRTQEEGVMSDDVSPPVFTDSAKLCFSHCVPSSLTQTKTKMQAKFMEDVEMNTVGLDDTLAKMERAMAQRKGVSVEELDVSTGTGKEVLDDGW
jgi:hypothetical protein